MKARYADLLWELPERLAGAKRDVRMARIAVDSYLDAVQTQRYKSGSMSIAKARRSLNIALSINDQERIDRARDVMLALDDYEANDGALPLSGFCFDTFVEPPHPRIVLTEAQHAKLVANVESRLSGFASQPSGSYHPADAETDAKRLATHYRRRGLSTDVARVLRSYGAIVQKMSGTAAPLVVNHSLHKLFDLYKAFNLNAEADALNESLRIAGEDAVKGLKEISATVQIPREQWEAYFTAMLAGDSVDVLVRIAMYYVPRRSEMEAELRHNVQAAPFTYLVTIDVKDDDGRTVAKVEPLASDPEGHLVRHISQHLSLTSILLRETMKRALDGQIAPETLMDFLFGCHLFREGRRPLLEEGVRAYAEGNSSVAIHILLPQIEQIVRHAAQAVGAHIYAQRRGGGFHSRTLDDLLRDPAIANALTDDVAQYFQVLLTDSRGWNIRNRVCHGLAPVSLFRVDVADRIVHALLVLALLRPVDQSTPERGSRLESVG